MKMNDNEKNSGMPRRSFLKTAAVGGAALSVVPNMAFGKNKKEDGKVRIGFLGTRS